MTSKQKPEIRFPGFMRDWEHRSLGDLGSIAMCKRIFKEQTKESGEIPFFKIGTFGKSPDSFISRELFNEYRDKYSFPEEGDILISASGTIGRTVVYNGEEAYYQDSNIVWLKRDKEKLDNLFLQQFYQIVKWSGIEGSTIKRLYNNNILATELFLPSLEEQAKIGNFLKQLDKIINFHQCELNSVKKLKFGLLQKMFPQNGEAFPEIRFPEFTDAWEQRKAKELFNPMVEKGHSDLPVLSVTQEFGVVYRKDVGIDIKYDPSTLKDYKVIHPGDFVISLRSFQGGFELSDKLGITSPAYTIFKPKETKDHDNLFWKTQFKTFKFIESLKTVTFGIRDGKSISFSEFGDLKLLFPSNKDEQVMIGQFFSSLDHLVTIHQHELDALKETKKAFLQKMFV